MRATRYEFSKDVKRQARHRAEDQCEAVGPLYGLPLATRCYGDLSKGVEFDHYPLPATDRDSDTLENCVAVCKACHRIKTSTYDVPMQAKAKRVSDKHLGITRPKSRLRSAGFPKAAPQRTATREIVRTRYINEEIDR